MSSINFFGFSPTKELKAFSKKQLQQLFELAPSDSSSTGHVKKTDEGFIGELNIHSLAGRFFAQVKSADPMGVVEGLTEKLLKQIDSWKELRLFSQPALFEEPQLEIPAKLDS